MAEIEIISYFRGHARLSLEKSPVETFDVRIIYFARFESGMCERSTEELSCTRFFNDRFIHLSLCLSLSSPICNSPSACAYTVRLICALVRLSIRPSVHCLFVRPSVLSVSCPDIADFVHSLIHLSFHPFDLNPSSIQPSIQSTFHSFNPLPLQRFGCMITLSLFQSYLARCDSCSLICFPR